jgi:hypothetical protein
MSFGRPKGFSKETTLMKRSIRWIVPAAAVVVIASLAPAVNAQGGPGGFNPPPALMAKFKAWQKWRDNHKNVNKLQTTLFAFRELEKDPSTKITKDQAKKIVPVLKAWRNKPVMTDDQAKDVNKQLTASLNDKQLKTLATAPNPMQGGRGFGGGARPGGGAAGGGAGGGGGGMAQMDPSKFPDPKDFNPLNPDSSPFKSMNPQRFSEMKGKFAEFVASLEARAK